eukprot:CAMPEP_0171333490 /NCGR_PEP_ID=MMETSP0878-20121228/4042_1 /TAXON_ID=67004 /ORGANISM="Thalassiosira weissflogii, Strain CCMP1336" /LENGTH=711 /DNA_ID=CAMNT_0011834437 /DNA_START=239 /DNA_END=2374 /DNA_ORIENTATION=+
MRIATAAIALFQTTILNWSSCCCLVDASPSIGCDSFVNNKVSHPWGVVPHGGETSPAPSKSSLETTSTTSMSTFKSVAGQDDETPSINATTTTEATASSYHQEIPIPIKTASSRVVDAVSAGGAVADDSSASSASGGNLSTSATPAFVGTAASLTSLARKSPPYGKGENVAPASSELSKQKERQRDGHQYHGQLQKQPIYSTSSSNSALAVATNNNEAAELMKDIIATSNKDIHVKEGSVEENTKNGPLKILFLSSDTGGGHRASAEALANQFQRHYPGTTYDLMDVWTDIDSCWPYYTIKDTYKSYSATPWKWRTLYHVSNNALYAKFVDYHSYYMNEEKIRQKMETYDPDVVVSVHPTMNYVPLFAIRKISQKLNKDIPFFTVVTDFGSGHCTWFNKDVDKMYLASEPIRKIAQNRGGVPDEKIFMTGLPIRYDFACQADAMGDRTSERGKEYQRQMRERLEIDPNKRMVLVMGGGEGVGSLSDIVNELYAKFRMQGVNATICVVCGRNEKLKKDLETRCWDTVVSQSLNSYESLRSRFFTKLLQHASRSRRIQMALDRAAAKAAKGKDVADTPGNVTVVPMGFVTNMAEYMVAADVLVSKAGPGTIAEAAAVGLPVMVTSHLPGQEAGNVDIVLNGGFGDFCEDPESIGLEVACWLQDPQLLDVMSQKAMKVGHPHAAEEIVLDIGRTTHQWIERNLSRNAETNTASE